jgi:hypothetical protein
MSRRNLGGSVPEEAQSALPERHPASSEGASLTKNPMHARGIGSVKVVAEILSVDSYASAASTPGRRGRVQWCQSTGRSDVPDNRLPAAHGAGSE